MSHEQAIERIQNRRAIYVERNTQDAARGFSPGLWDDEIRDCDCMIARLAARMVLTDYQRGLVA